MMTTTLNDPARPVAATPRVVARLFGGLDVRCDGVRIDPGLPQAALLILTYLLVHAGEQLRRDDIAFELWPDETECDAKAALRRSLYVLQQSLPKSPAPFVRCDKLTVTALPEPGDGAIDVVRFALASEFAESLDEAADLYRGDFAPRLDHEWAFGFRERLRKRAIRVLETLLTRACERNDDASSLRYADRLLEIDPWREDVFCRTLQVRFRLGDRAGAVHAYGSFRTNLLRELGVEPMPETRARYEAICGA